MPDPRLDKIREYISTDNLKEALDLAEQVAAGAGANAQMEITLLKGRMTALKVQQRQETISPADYRTALAQLRAATLALLPILGGEEQGPGVGGDIQPPRPFPHRVLVMLAGLAVVGLGLVARAESLRPAYVVDSFEDQLDFADWTPPPAGPKGSPVRRKYTLAVMANLLVHESYIDMVGTDGSGMECSVEIGGTPADCVQETGGNNSLPTMKQAYRLEVPRERFSWIRTSQLRYAVTTYNAYPPASKSCDGCWFGKRFRYPVRNYRVVVDLPQLHRWTHVKVTRGSDFGAAGAPVYDADIPAGARRWEYSALKDLAPGEVVVVRYEGG